MSEKSEKRMTDSAPVYTVHTQLRHDGVMVRCPDCGGCAIYRLTQAGYHLACTRCHLSKLRAVKRPIAAAQGCCSSCNRWFNLHLSPHQAGHHKLRIQCPVCGAMQDAQVHMVGYESRNVMEGLSLYFQDSFRGHTVWALNRAHLSYLIGYVEAGLREKAIYANGPDRFYASEGQARHLPKWMKQAKNRRALLHVLQRMQQL